jgi:hypothetical protein
MKKQLLLALALSFYASWSYGQGLEELSNLHKERLLELYGQPDRAITSSGEEQLYYGRSVIFLSAGRVTGWSDSGDLVSRRIQTQFTRPRETPGAYHGWENAWTRAKDVTPEEVIDDLLLQAKESDGKISPAQKATESSK